MYWQHVIGMVCVLAACHRYGVYWQHVIGMVCVLAACQCVLFAVLSATL